VDEFESTIVMALEFLEFPTLPILCAWNMWWFHYLIFDCFYSITKLLSICEYAATFFWGNLSLKSDTKGNFRERFLFSKWMKSLKCSQILRWYHYIFGWIYLIRWINVISSTSYLQHGSFKFMDVNSSVTPLKIATCAA
jgi:hypothetical protein